MMPAERIEQAVVLLMDHFDLDDEKALAVLKALSRGSGMRMSEVAQTLLEQDKLAHLTGRGDWLAGYVRMQIDSWNRSSSH